MSLNSLSERRSRLKKRDSLEQPALPNILKPVKPDASSGSHSFERKLLDEMLAPSRKTPFNGVYSKPVHLTQDTATQQQSLLTSMATRLSQLEKAHRALRNELIGKDKELLEYRRH